MESLIEAFTSSAGWAGSSPKAAFFAYNDIPDYVAGLNAKSMIFRFQNSPAGEYVEKSVTMNLTGYEEIVFHVWSRNKQGSGVGMSKSGDFAYKIEFGTADGYFVPLFPTFEAVTFGISGIGSITKIRVTCLHDSDDYLILSNMVAVKDELPVDIWRAAKKQLESDFLSLYPRISGGTSGKGILLGTVNGAAGDKSIIFSNSLKLIEKYAVIMIEGGGHSETHQIDHNDSLEFFFNTKYSGKTLLYTYAAANVYLIIPVEYGLTETEIILPGISIFGMNPEEDLEMNKLDHNRDTFKTSEVVGERLNDAIFDYLVMIDCEARTHEMLAFMSLAVRYFLARQILWCNGRPIEIRPEGVSNYIEPVEAVNEIPKIQYMMSLSVKETVYSREQLVKTISNIRTFDIRRV